MKLYLSSYKVGNKTEELKKWIEKNNNKICLIPNARDFYTDEERRKAAIGRDVQQLTDLGFDVTVISLKDYFYNKEKLFNRLDEFNAFYVIGGNTFVLRQAMYLSGFDEFIKKIENNANYLYAGYSAGICVLAKDMHGLDVCDDPNMSPYGIDTMWNGLGYFDCIFLPHYKSNHSETKLIDDSVEYCNINNISYKTLRDGDVIIMEIENNNNVLNHNIEMITEQNRDLVNKFLIDNWYSTDMSIRDEKIDGTKLPGYVVIEDNKIIGLITYKLYNDICEIISLDSKKENIGLGTALIKKVEEIAIENNCVKTRLITTNDNLRSLQFYQKRGYYLTKLYLNAMDEVRKTKPNLPEIGDNGIPLRDEIELEKKL